MTNEQKPKIENLELNRETVADLIEADGEQVKGGAAGEPLDGVPTHRCRSRVMATWCEGC
jgi:hypothetical protein